MVTTKVHSTASPHSNKWITSSIRGITSFLCLPDMGICIYIPWEFVVFNEILWSAEHIVTFAWFAVDSYINYTKETSTLHDLNVKFTSLSSANFIIYCTLSTHFQIFLRKLCSAPTTHTNRWVGGWTKPAYGRQCDAAVGFLFLHVPHSCTNGQE